MAQTTQEQAVQAASFLGCDASELVNPFDLSAIVSSKGFQPMKIVLYGVPGIGKTTFAGTFPSSHPTQDGERGRRTGHPHVSKSHHQSSRP